MGDMNLVMDGHDCLPDDSLVVQCVQVVTDGAPPPLRASG